MLLVEAADRDQGAAHDFGELEGIVVGAADGFEPPLECGGDAQGERRIVGQGLFAGAGTGLSHGEQFGCVYYFVSQFDDKLLARKSAIFSKNPRHILGFTCIAWRRKPGGMPQVPVRVDNSMSEQMDRIRARYGLNRSQVIRAALMSWLDRFAAAAEPERAQMIIGAPREREKVVSP